MLPERTTDLLNAGEYVAASLPPSDGLRRWIAVFPFKVNPLTGMTTLNAPSEPWKYRVRCVGLSPNFDYENYDLHDEDLTSYEDSVVEDLASVEEIASRWLEELESLEDPRKCDCPI